jgi:hypothetical protein
MHASNAIDFQLSGLTTFPVAAHGAHCDLSA